MSILTKIRTISSSRYLVNKGLRKFILSSLKGRKFNVVVDIGAGRSPYKKYIKYHKYIRVDVEDRMGDDNLIIADLNESIPMNDKSVDLVIMTEVLEHIKNPQTAIKEVYRILNDDGLLLLTTPFVWSLHEEPEDYFRYTKYGLKYLLENAGFKDIIITPRSNNFVTVCQVFNLGLRRKIFIPIVIFFNILGYFGEKFSKTYNLPIGYGVLSKK